MVASRAATFQQAVAAQWESRRGRTRLVSVDVDDNDTTMEDASRRRVHIVEPVRGIEQQQQPPMVVADENDNDDEWDDWETNGLEPHPQQTTSAKPQISSLLRAGVQPPGLHTEIVQPSHETAPSSAGPVKKKVTQRKND